MRIRQKEIRRARKRHEERVKEARKTGTVAQAPVARPAQTRTLTARAAPTPGQRGERGGRGEFRGGGEGRGDRGPRPGGGEGRGDRGGDRGPRPAGEGRGDRGPRPDSANRPPRDAQPGANPADAIVNTEGAGATATPTGEPTTEQPGN